jgi:hypothetical protein
VLFRLTLNSPESWKLLWPLRKVPSPSAQARKSSVGAKNGGKTSGSHGSPLFVFNHFRRILIFRSLAIRFCQTAQRENGNSSSRASRDRPARHALRVCRWQTLWVNDPVYSFIFWFPLECSANPRRKQLLNQTELVQTGRNRPGLVPIATAKFGTGFMSVGAELLQRRTSQRGWTSTERLELRRV